MPRAKPRRQSVQGLNGKAIPILYVTNIPVGEGESGTILGQWSPLSRTITLREDLAPETARQTLAHELFHAFLWDSGLTRVLGEEVEEALCNLVGTMLVDQM